MLNPLEWVYPHAVYRFSRAADQEGDYSLGHPVGATGAIIATKAIHELHRIGGRYALVTMCIGGGQGIALAIERI